MKVLEITDKVSSKLKQECLQLLEQQMQAIGENFNSKTVKLSFEKSLKVETARSFLLVDNEEKGVGIMFCNICFGIQSGGNYLWLNEIFVHPQHRKKGYGLFMLNFLNDWAKQNNCTKILGITWQGNTASKNMFSKNGFELDNLVWLEKGV